MARGRTAYPKEVREAAKNLVLVDGLSVEEAADKSNVPPGTLKFWLKMSRKPASKIIVQHKAQENPNAVRVKQLEQLRTEAERERLILIKALKIILRYI